MTAQDSEALRLAYEARDRIASADNDGRTVSIIQLAILKGMAWQRGDVTPTPAEEGAAWPIGCKKRSSCARHKQCMYGTFGSCPHHARTIAKEVEDAA